jgi:hypothetical protein
MWKSYSETSFQIFLSYSTIDEPEGLAPKQYLLDNEPDGISWQREIYRWEITPGKLLLIA